MDGALTMGTLIAFMLNTRLVAKGKEGPSSVARAGSRDG
jgi:hypothetical protein